MINHAPKTEEVFEKAYVDKNTGRSVQVWPVPEDLDNWHEIDFDPSFKYSGKRYDAATGEWFEVESEAEKHNRRNKAERRRAYVETDKLFMEWQYDQTTEAREAWEQAVAKVKEDFPFK